MNTIAECPIQTCYNFLGLFNYPNDLPENPKAGDIFMSVPGDILMGYNGNEWFELGTGELGTNDYQEPVRERKKVRNCKNCGAPAGKNDYCEYCWSPLWEDE